MFLPVSYKKRNPFVASMIYIYIYIVDIWINSCLNLWFIYILTCWYSYMPYCYVSICASVLLHCSCSWLDISIYIFVKFIVMVPQSSVHCHAHCHAIFDLIIYMGKEAYFHVYCLTSAYRYRPMSVYCCFIYVHLYMHTLCSLRYLLLFVHVYLETWKHANCYVLISYTYRARCHVS